MKQLPEDEFLRELFDGETLSNYRGRSLEKALLAVKRARQKQRIRRIGWGVSASILALLALVYGSRPNPNIRASLNIDPPPNPTTASAYTHHDLIATDEELLALFTNRAVALIGKPGQQQLVFLDTAGNLR